MPNFDVHPSSPTQDAGSPRFPHNQKSLSRPAKHTNNGNSISAKERGILDAAKARLILPRNKRPSLRERSDMLRDALEKKKTAVHILASAQSDIETHSSFLIEEQGLEETIRFYDANYDIGDRYTAFGRFMKLVSSITYANYSVVANDKVNDKDPHVCAT